MRFPGSARYNEAVQNPKLFFRDPEIARRQVQTDALGLPEVLSGGFAFTYRFGGYGRDIAVRCFHRGIPDLFERYAAISAFLAGVRSPFFVDFAFAERGVRIEGADLPSVRMDWVEGETLLGYVARRRNRPEALAGLRAQLLAFAAETESRGYAHGDVQHRNIMVLPDGALRLVDYDAVFVPALRHLRAADSGHPHFQPPSRSAADFGPRMDRFPLAVLDLSLHALQGRPALFEQFHRGENLILSRDDFLDPAASPVLDAMARLPGLATRVAAFRGLCALAVSEMPTLAEFSAPVSVAARSPARAASGAPRGRTHASPFDVVDGMDFSRTQSFVGRPVELVGQVLQVVELAGKDMVQLRFGTRYTATPAVVMRLSLFRQWPHAAAMARQPWISASGVLQTHTSGRYATVQVLVRETSDVELLSGRAEAEFRLGRAAQGVPRPPATPPRRNARSRTAPPAKPLPQPRSRQPALPLAPPAATPRRAPANPMPAPPARISWLTRLARLLFGGPGRP